MSRVRALPLPGPTIPGFPPLTPPTSGDRHALPICEVEAWSSAPPGPVAAAEVASCGRREKGGSGSGRRRERGGEVHPRPPSGWPATIRPAPPDLAPGSDHAAAAAADPVEGGEVLAGGGARRRSRAGSASRERTGFGRRDSRRREGWRRCTGEDGDQAEERGRRPLRRRRRSTSPVRDRRKLHRTASTMDNSWQFCPGMGGFPQGSSMPFYDMPNMPMQGTVPVVGTLPFASGSQGGGTRTFASGSQGVATQNFDTVSQGAATETFAAGSPPPGTGRQSKKTTTKPKNPNFSVNEDKILVSCWLNVNLDPITGAGQRKSSFWKTIVQSYNAQKGPTHSKRTLRSLEGRWSDIKEQANKFECHYNNVLSERRSGYSNMDKGTSGSLLSCPCLMKIWTTGIYWNQQKSYSLISILMKNSCLETQLLYMLMMTLILWSKSLCICNLL